WALLADAPELADVAGPPLTANRTMGALASIAASRVARAFRLGGPSFTVSSAETSGLSALHIAFRALQRGEIDVALVGAVDCPGDVRATLVREREAGEHVPSRDGAVAILLRRQGGAAQALFIRNVELRRGDADAPVTWHGVGHVGAATGLF